MSYVEDNWLDWITDEIIMRAAKEESIDEYINEHSIDEILKTIDNKIKSDPEIFNCEDLKVMNSILNYYDKNGFVTDKQLKYIISLAEIVD